MRACYVFGGRLGGSGIGQIAGHAAAGVNRVGALKAAVATTVARHTLPATRVRTLPFGRYLRRIPNYYLKDVAFDAMAARELPTNVDLVHGWNGMCLRTLNRAAENGAVTVVERASSHPTTQQRLIDRELKTHSDDASGRRLDDRHHDRQVAELVAADAVFVPSGFVYDSHREQGFDNDSLVPIPFGVDASAFDSSDNTTDDGGFTALFVGQVSVRKGVQYLLPAWERADVAGELRLAGEVTPDAEVIADQYRDDPSISFLGYVNDVVEEYRRADAFVFPSVEEGSALVSYEAMAAGLPSVVTPNVGSLVRDEREGLVIPPRDADAVADAIERLAADAAARTQMSEAARDRVSPYTWERYGDRVATAHERLVERDGDATGIGWLPEA